MTFKVVVVDDEPLARDGIIALLQTDGEIEVVAECGDGDSAVRAFHEHSPDLMLLDVEMPGMNGLEVVEAIGAANMPAVIFITAFDQYAVRAFEAHAVEYVHKPFTDARFSQAVSRAKQTLRDRKLARMSESLMKIIAERRPHHTSRIAVKTGKRAYFIPADDIEWIEGADYCAKIHTPERWHMVRESLSSLAARLDPSRFMRVHRSAIVNVTCIREIRAGSSHDAVAVLATGARVPISRGRRSKLESLLESAH